jgi:DNA-binding beta-propeller fold protein YncE
VVYNDDFTSILSETDSRIVQIGGKDFKVKTSIITGKTGDGFNPVHFSADRTGTKLYVLESEGVYVMDINDDKLPSDPLISGSFYGLEVSPSDGNIYCLKSNGYTSSGSVQIYSSDGTLLNDVTAGIAPNGAVFY